MKIFITNDDGISSDGIKALALRLAEEHEVLVIAPESERSAYSHSLSILKPMKFQSSAMEHLQVYSLDGTPADCTKFMSLHYRDFVPELVISGINRGENLGRDILYSGTVGAAMEGGIMGYRAIAVSSTGRSGNDFAMCADLVCRMLPELMTLDYQNTIYNINIPNIARHEIAGVRFARLGSHTFDDHYIGEGDHYTLCGDPLENDESAEDSDVALNRLNYITVTPLLCDRTNFELLGRLPKELKL